jgi:hypothetical protein
MNARRNIPAVPPFQVVLSRDGAQPLAHHLRSGELNASANLHSGDFQENRLGIACPGPCSSWKVRTNAVADANCRADTRGLFSVAIRIRTVRH